MATATATTKFDNAATGDLADMLGGLDAEAKALDARIAEIKAELKARGVEAAEGKLYTVSRVEAVRWTLDTSKIKQEMGEAWATARSKVAAVTSFRIGVNRAALASLAA
jgi:hypothetical protein